jgi:hypothetical protein
LGKDGTSRYLLFLNSTNVIPTIVAAAVAAVEAGDIPVSLRQSNAVSTRPMTAYHEYVFFELIFTES